MSLINIHSFIRLKGIRVNNVSSFIRIDSIHKFVHACFCVCMYMHFVYQNNLSSCKHPAEFLKWNNPPSIFGTVHYHFRDIKMKTWSWSANSLEPDQTAQKCRLAWLYTGGKAFWLSNPQQWGSSDSKTMTFNSSDIAAPQIFTSEYHILAWQIT